MKAPTVEEIEKFFDNNKYVLKYDSRRNQERDLLVYGKVNNVAVILFADTVTEDWPPGYYAGRIKQVPAEDTSYEYVVRFGRTNEQVSFNVNNDQDEHVLIYELQKKDVELQQKNTEGYFAELVPVCLPSSSGTNNFFAALVQVYIPCFSGDINNKLLVVEDDVETEEDDKSDIQIFPVVQELLKKAIHRYSVKDMNKTKKLIDSFEQEIRHYRTEEKVKEIRRLAEEEAKKAEEECAAFEKTFKSLEDNQKKAEEDLQVHLNKLEALNEQKKVLEQQRQAIKKRKQEALEKLQQSANSQ